MAVVENRKRAAARQGVRRGRSFKPHYPVWLTSPSFAYYAIFFIRWCTRLLPDQVGLEHARKGHRTADRRVLGSAICRPLGGPASSAGPGPPRTLCPHPPTEAPRSR